MKEFYRWLRFLLIVFTLWFMWILVMYYRTKQIDAEGLFTMAYFVFVGLYLAGGEIHDKKE